MLKFDLVLGNDGASLDLDDANVEIKVFECFLQNPGFASDFDQLFVMIKIVARFQQFDTGQTIVFDAIGRVLFYVVIESLPRDFFC